MPNRRAMLLACLAATSGGYAMSQPNSPSSDPTKSGQEVSYLIDGKRYSGRLFRPSGEVRAGLIYAPDWYGIYDYSLSMARDFAALGFATFVPDVYGADIRITSDAEAMEPSQYLRDNPREASRRMQAGYLAFRAAVPEAPYTAACGFSLGGFCVMEFLKDFDGLKAAVILSGALGPLEGDYASGTVPVRFHHGSQDVVASLDRVREITAFLEQRGCDCALTVYAGAKHAFTNPNLPSVENSWLAYDPRYAAEATASVERFLMSLKPGNVEK